MKSTTCLGLGFDPTNANYKPLVCNNCTVFWETKLKYDLTTYAKQKNQSVCWANVFSVVLTMRMSERWLCGIRWRVYLPGTVVCWCWTRHKVLLTAWHQRVNVLNLCARVPLLLVILNKSKALQGCTNLFDYNGTISVNWTNIILGTMDGRTNAFRRQWNSSDDLFFLLFIGKLLNTNLLIRHVATRFTISYWKPDILT